LNLVTDRVKPDRVANKRASYAKYWWRLGEPRRASGPPSPDSNDSS
jgi:hypothetical protein